MKKKIAIITTGEEYARIQSQQLSRLFKDHVEVSTYACNTGDFDHDISADLVIASIPSLYYKSVKSIPKKTKVIIPNTTITDNSFNMIRELPQGSHVLVVNDSFISAMETINLFNDLELDHLVYDPYYPSVENCPELSIAVTPGELSIVPDHVSQIIDIGHRVMDSDTLTEIAIHLNLEHLLTEGDFTRYLQTIKTVKNKLTSQFNNFNALERQLLSVLNVMDEGILIIDSDGAISTFNEKALSIIGVNYILTHRMIKKVIPQIEFEEVFQTGLETEHNVIRINSQHVSVKVVPVLSSGTTINAVVLINDFNKQEATQHKIRSKVLKKDHSAKYTFESILSCEPSFIDLKNLVKKQAKSNASVLISGESGTGKEIFAQAIHNASIRKDYSFIAVNCAALPENLMESELFGYEEGAFTGAKKGGKPGYFEVAHNGTLFLDEIGEMKPSLQTRLLRVLEEREVTRLGGNKTIPIDIRIISATNKNLWQMIRTGQFREDLFYRLNVLPINLPPLRERKEDITLLFERFKESIHSDFTLSNRARQIITDHPWYGNIRELRNSVEYLASLDKAFIEPSDLSTILGLQYLNHPVKEVIPDEYADFIDSISKEIDAYIFLLDCLHTSYAAKKRIGRRSILIASQSSDVFLTEAQIRKMLTILEIHDFVILSNGRGGTTITSSGIKALQFLRESTSD